MLDSYRHPEEGDKREADGITYTWVIRKEGEHITIGEWKEDTKVFSMNWDNLSGLHI